MLMLAVIRVMSMALSRSIQRQVTGRFIQEPEVAQAILLHPTQFNPEHCIFTCSIQKSSGGSFDAPSTNKSSALGGTNTTSISRERAV